MLFLLFLEHGLVSHKYYYTYDTNTGQRTRMPYNFQPPWSLYDDTALFVLFPAT